MKSLSHYIYTALAHVKFYADTLMLRKILPEDILYQDLGDNYKNGLSLYADWHTLIKAKFMAECIGKKLIFRFPACYSTDSASKKRLEELNNSDALELIKKHYLQDGPTNLLATSFDIFRKIQ